MSSKKGAKIQSDYLTVDDPFERNGQIMSLKVPCVVTAIDPEYNLDANRHLTFRKFNVKTDILRLRDVTRKKFVMYATEQHRLKRARDQEIQTKIYQQAMDFINMANKTLDSVERKAFREMQAENERLRKLQLEDNNDELNTCVSQHQKLSTEVKDIHKRFLFLLKLIRYFSGDNESINILESTDIPGLGEYAFLKDDLIADNITADLVEQLNEYLGTVAKPFLAKRTHLNADIWIDGYEYTRRKLYNFYKQMTELAVLNHVDSIIYEKFLKSYNQQVAKPIVRAEPNKLKERTLKLQNEVNRILEEFGKNQIKDKVFRRIKGIAPVMLEDIQGSNKKDEKKNPDNQLTTMGQFEEIHSVLMGILNELDTIDPSLVKYVEKETRLYNAWKKKSSRKALAEENRFKNWIEHYKKHYKPN